MNVFVRDPFASLVMLSVVASTVAALFIALASSRLMGNSWSGAAVAVVALLSPALLVFGPLPAAGSTAVAFVAAAFYFFAAQRPELFAASAAAAIGVQPQIAPAMLVVLGIGLLALPRKGRSVAVFAVATVVMFAPLDEVRLFEVEPQLRRELVVRFVAHPWGGKFLSLPLLAAVAAGAVISTVRHRNPVVLALGAFGVVHIATVVAIASSLQGVQPMLPAIVPMAFFAVAAFARRPAVAAALSAVFAAGSLAYTWPALAQHARDEPPPVAAMRYATRAMPDAVVVAAPDLASFSLVVGDGLEVVTPERLGDFVSHPEVEVQLFVHGRSHVADAVVFERAASDVCRKLTSDRFHLVSLVPHPPARRYTARSGIYQVESSPELGEWRWLSREAGIEPPPLPPVAAVRLRFRLPDDAPIDSNRLTVAGETVDIARGATVEVTVPAARRMVIRAERSFAPGDGRELAVQLTILDFGI